VNGNAAYVANLDHKVYAIDPNTGKPAWDQPFEASDVVRSSPVMLGGSLIVIDGNGNVYSLDPGTGKQKLPAPVVLGKSVKSDPLPQDKQLLVLAEGGDLYRVDPSGQTAPTLLQVKK